HGTPLEEDVFVAFFDGLFVIGQVQRAFLAAAGEGGGEHGERDEGQQQALHGGVLCEIENGSEYTGPPAPCLCAGSRAGRGRRASPGLPRERRLRLDETKTTEPRWKPPPHSPARSRSPTCRACWTTSPARASPATSCWPRCS